MIRGVLAQAPSSNTSEKRQAARIVVVPNFRCIILFPNLQVEGIQPAAIRGQDRIGRLEVAKDLAWVGLIENRSSKGATEVVHIVESP